MKRVSQHNYCSSSSWTLFTSDHLRKPALVSGQLPLDPNNGQLIIGDLATQTRRVLANTAPSYVPKTWTTPILLKSRLSDRPLPIRGVQQGLRRLFSHRPRRRDPASKWPPCPKALLWRLTSLRPFLPTPTQSNNFWQGLPAFPA